MIVVCRLATSFQTLLRRVAQPLRHVDILRPAAVGVLIEEHIVGNSHGLVRLVPLRGPTKHLRPASALLSLLPTSGAPGHGDEKQRKRAGPILFHGNLPNRKRWGPAILTPRRRKKGRKFLRPFRALCELRGESPPW